jgi:translocation and assembly module TamA
VLAGRVRVGGIVNGGIPQIPASQRFYAGGGGSVRGFSYQGVGPQLSDGTPQGGASLVELSAEVRQKLAGKWGVVAFVDAGAVGTDQFPGADNLAIGAGFGVRYDLGFGPIRFDIATPVTKRDGNAAFQIYVSIGQSF